MSSLDDIESSTINLISSDNITYTLDKESSKISNFIKTILEEDSMNNEIKLDIHSSHLKHIVKFINMYKEDPYDYAMHDHPLGIFLSGDRDIYYCLPKKYGDFSKFEEEFKDSEFSLAKRDFIFKMMNEAGKLHIEPLEHTLTVQISSWFKNKNMDDIVEMFSDVSKEEHARFQEEAKVEADEYLENLKKRNDER